MSIFTSLGYKITLKNLANTHWLQVSLTAFTHWLQGLNDCKVSLTANCSLTALCSLTARSHWLQFAHWLHNAHWLLSLIDCTLLIDCILEAVNYDNPIWIFSRIYPLNSRNIAWDSMLITRNLWVWKWRELLTHFVKGTLFLLQLIFSDSCFENYQD